MLAASQFEQLRPSILTNDQGCRAERPRTSDRSLRSPFLLRIPDNNLNIRESIPSVKPDTPAYRNKLNQA